MLEAAQAWLRYRGEVLALTQGASRFISGQDFPAWFRELDQLKIGTEAPKPRMIHLLYEAGAFLLDNDVRALPFYAVDTTFEKKDFAPRHSGQLILKERDGISYDEYVQAYERVQKHLFAGNAYQVNLTFPFSYELDANCSERDTYVFLHHAKAASMAHVNFWPKRDLSFISNTPETLFSITKHDQNHWRVVTKPIKGTAKSDAWSELKASDKNRAELFMITDLVKNDLNRLSHGVAQVDALQARLDVPGLVHQYSEVSALIPGTTSLAEVLRCLFPGGSITGAPKKRVMQIIDEIEHRPRRFYCGSTIYWDGHELSASINIRSGTIDWTKREACFHAGGGITVQSSPEEEWQEMLAKLQSLEGAITQGSP